ncbi:MAG: sugar ABC transporter permease [Suipraeoptans sp.]
MSEQKKERRIDIFGLIYKNSLIVEMLIVAIIFQVLSKGLFLGVQNLSNILLQGATCALIAITMCLVIITCNADLSAGRLLGMFGMIAAILQVSKGLSSVAIMIIIYILAIVIGIWHGFWVGYMKLPAFIVTLATQLVFNGITLLISAGKTFGPIDGIISTIGNKYLPSISGNSNDTSLILAGIVAVVYVIFMINRERKNAKQGLAATNWKKVGVQIVGVLVVLGIITAIVYNHRGFSYSMLILFVLTLIISYIISNTKFGRYIYAIGGNVDAAKLSGINVPRETLKLYIMHTMVVATAALVYVGRVGQAASAAGQGYEFTAITGCVVGGTAITGGRGTVMGAVVGTMIMAALDNGMSILNLGVSMQYVVRGLVLLAAIALDVVAENRKSKIV